MFLPQVVLNCSREINTQPGEAEAEAGAGAEWKLQPDIVLMNPVCASHPCCLNINIKAAQLGYTFIPRAHKRTSSSPTRARRRPVVPTCVPQGLFYSSPMLDSGGFLSQRRRGGDEEIHLLIDSAILDFCYSPSVTWSAPTFLPGAGSAGWKCDYLLVYGVISCVCVCGQEGVWLWGCSYDCVVNKEEKKKSLWACPVLKAEVEEVQAAKPTVCKYSVTSKTHVFRMGKLESKHTQSIKSKIMYITVS